MDCSISSKRRLSSSLVQTSPTRRRYHHAPPASFSSARRLLLLAFFAQFGLLSYPDNQYDNRRYLHLVRAQRATSAIPPRPTTPARVPTTIPRPPITVPSRPITTPRVTFPQPVTTVPTPIVPPIITTTTTTRAFSDNVITISQGTSGSGGSKITGPAGPSGTPYTNKLPPSNDTTSMLTISLVVVFALLGGVGAAVICLFRRRTRRRRLSISSGNGVEKDKGSGGKSRTMFGGDKTKNSSKTSDKRRPKRQSLPESAAAAGVGATNGKRASHTDVQELRRASTMSMGIGACAGTLHGSGFEGVGSEKMMMEHHRYSSDLSSLPIELPTLPLETLHPSDPEGRRRSNISARSPTHSPSMYPQTSSPHPFMNRASNVPYNSNPYGAGGPLNPYSHGTGGPSSRALLPFPGGHNSREALNSANGMVIGNGEFVSAPTPSSGSLRTSLYDSPNGPADGTSLHSEHRMSYFGPQQHHTPYPGYGIQTPPSEPALSRRSSRSPTITGDVEYVPPPNQHQRFSQQLLYLHQQPYPHSPGVNPLDCSKTMNNRHSQPFPGMMNQHQHHQSYSPFLPPAHANGSFASPSGMGSSDSETVASSTGSGVSRTGSNVAVMMRPKSASSASSPAINPQGVGASASTLAGSSPSSSVRLESTASPSLLPSSLTGQRITPPVSAEIVIPAGITSRPRSSHMSPGVAVSVVPPPFSHQQHHQPYFPPPPQTSQFERHELPSAPGFTINTSSTPPSITATPPPRESLSEEGEELVTEESFHIVVPPSSSS